MKKLFLIGLLLAGCAGQKRYIEGTHFALGAYVPFQDGLYGVELVQYTSGAYMASTTNTPCAFTRQYSATNEYFWGMARTVETSKTRLEVEKHK